MSRLENTSKNFVYSIAGTILTSLLGFITRYVFVKRIGIEYVGANGLFTNVLSMLSLTELGLGSAIAFSLYKPLAENDTETIKSLMLFYKKAYRIIAIAIFSLGLCLIPFLKYIIKNPGKIEHVTWIYLIFLYNTSISYVFSYKTTLLNADQKTYLMTGFNMKIGVCTALIQLIVMVIFENYYIYLLSAAVINTCQWFFINRFIYKRYPYLQEIKVSPLSPSILKTIVTNVKAMVFHKVGELCINQTDNIIISAFISIGAVGLYDNYYTIIGIISRLANALFNAATASLGNLIATEGNEKRYSVFKAYNFLGFWVYSWTGICLFVLLTPFVELWLGKEYIIDGLTITLVMVNYYLVGMRTTVGNIKMAAGLYSQDQWVPIAQAIINLAVSILAVRKMGLAGVFLGTVVSSISIPCWYRPIVVYKYAFDKPVKEYFRSYVLYALITGANYFLVYIINSLLIETKISNVFGVFFLKMICCAIIPNATIVLLFRKTDEFQYIIGIIRTFWGKTRWGLRHS